MVGTEQLLILLFTKTVTLGAIAFADNFNSLGPILSSPVAFETSNREINLRTNFSFVSHLISVLTLEFTKCASCSKVDGLIGIFNLDATFTK